MTTEQFDRTGWGNGMKVKAHGRYGKIGIRNVVAVDFDQCLIGIKVSLDPDEPPQWIRCENCEIVTELKTGK